MLCAFATQHATFKEFHEEFSFSKLADFHNDLNYEGIYSFETTSERHSFQCSTKGKLFLDLNKMFMSFSFIFFVTY